MHSTIERFQKRSERESVTETRASLFVVCLFAAVGIALSLVVMLWSAEALGY